MQLSLFLLSAAAVVSTATAAKKIDLKTAGDYVILAKTGISTVPTSHVTGDIGVAPITGAAITGFDLVSDTSNTFSKSTQVAGSVYASDYLDPTPSWMENAVLDMETAYRNADEETADVSNLLEGEIGGQTLSPGVYGFDKDVKILPDTVLTFKGSATDVFIIQTTGSVKQAANTAVVLEGGALPENIFWQVAGEVTVGAGAKMQGVLLVKTGVTLITGSTLVGRILAQTAVALQKATVGAA
jgi:hypothetical protein